MTEISDISGDKSKGFVEWWDEENAIGISFMCRAGKSKMSIVGRQMSGMKLQSVVVQTNTSELSMIRSFRSNALKRFWTKNDGSKLSADWLPRIAIILDRLDAASKPADLNLPGFDFHSLKGALKGRYAVKVSGNYRITFGWHDGDATDVHLEDYH